MILLRAARYGGQVRLRRACGGARRREARRRGFGTAQVPNDKRAAEPLPAQSRDFSRSHSFQYAKNLKIRGIGCEQTADAADVEDSR